MFDTKLYTTITCRSRSGLITGTKINKRSRHRILQLAHQVDQVVGVIGAHGELVHPVSLTGALGRINPRARDVVELGQVTLFFRRGAAQP